MAYRLCAVIKIMFAKIKIKQHESSLRANNIAYRYVHNELLFFCIYIYTQIKPET